MRLQINHIYEDFFERTKNEPIVIMQGSKRSGKTGAKLIDGGLKLASYNGYRMQYFSESPKQQNHGLDYDFRKYFQPVLKSFKHDGTQKVYSKDLNQLSFINIPNNIRADNIANAMGACNERYINEVNMFTKSTFEKLLINNTGQMFVDYNPYREFWIQDYVTDKNFLKTTWRDNQMFLSENQIRLFLEWTEIGQRSEVGSYNYWRWQVMCEGNFAELTGEIFTTENIHFSKDLPDGLHLWLTMADPSNAKGNDNFANVLTAIDTKDQVWLVDSLSRNRIEKEVIAERIVKWRKDYSVTQSFLETNGEFGLKFYNDCIAAGIDVDGWYSRDNKFERIMANHDVITKKLMVYDTPANREFVQQFYTFRNPDEKDENGKKPEFKDDNIDCLNNAILAYIRNFGKLKVLFV